MLKSFIYTVFIVSAFSWIVDLIMWNVYDKHASEDDKHQDDKHQDE